MKSCNLSRYYIVATCILVLVSLSNTPALAIGFSTFQSGADVIVTTGQQVPGLSNATFDSLGEIDVNSKGQAVFSAMIDDASGSSLTSALKYDPIEGISSVVIASITQPEAPSNSTINLIDGYSAIQIDEEGRVLISAQAVDANNQMFYGYWQTDLTGSLNLLLKSGDTTDEFPNGPGFFSSSFGGYTTNNQAMMPFTANYSGGDAAGLYITNQTHEITTLVLNGDPAPGIGPNGTFTSLSNDFPITDQINDQGQIAFDADSTVGRGIWLWNATDDIRNIAHKGQQAPGLESGETFDFINDLFSITDDGYVFFNAGTEFVNDSFTNGFWLSNGQTSQLIFATGQPSDQTIQPEYLSNEFFINNKNQIAFGASVTGDPEIPFSSGIWTGTSQNDMELVAQTSRPAPGIEGATWNYLMLLDINDLGQILFQGIVDAPNTPYDNQSGLWIRRPDGVVELVAIAGGTIDVDPTESISLKTINSLWTFQSNAVYGGVSNQNNLGQISFRATFAEGGEGLFITQSNLSTIPEPSTCLLLLASSLALFSKSRRASIRPRSHVG